MKSFYKKIGLSILMIAATFCGYSQTLMPLPTQTSTFNGNSRGYWFVAPTDFTITGVRVPTDAGSGVQNIAVIRLAANPPVFGATTNNFIQEALFQNVAGNAIQAVNIQVQTGEVIGIFGDRGGINSYASQPNPTNIFGFPINLERLGFQLSLATNAPANVWTEINGNISRVEMYYAATIVEEFPYCQDFEANAGGWFSGGINNVWELGTPSNTVINAAAPGGTQSWATNLDGDYPTNSESSVTSIEVDMTELNNPHVGLDVWWESEFSWDGANLETSIDAGATWQTVGSTTSAGTNWYTDNDIDGLTFSGSDEGWTGRNGTGSTGGSNGWLASQHALTGLAGQSSVLVRVAFGSDGSVVDEGFAFDNICIGELNDVGVVAILVNDSVCGDDSTEVGVVVRNLGLNDQSAINVNVDTNGTSLNAFTVTNTLSVGDYDTTYFTFNSVAGGQFDFTSWTSLSGDDNINNDTVIVDSVLLYSLPTGLISGGGMICADSVTTVTIDITGGGSPWLIGFSDSTASTFVSGIGASPYTVTTNTPGEYTLLSISDSNGCQASVLTGSAIVVVNPLPVIDLGEDSTFCGSLLLDPGAFVSYEWQDGSTNQTFLATTNDNYAVTVTDANGCVGSDDVNLNANPLPVVNLGADIELCEGNFSTLDAGAGFLGYVWSDSSAGQILSVNTLGTYSVTVTDFNGCQGTDNIEVTAINPVPTISLGPDISVGPWASPVTLDATAGFAAYLWDDLTTMQTRDVTFDGTYYVEVTDDNGCKNSDTIVVDIWPNGVQPIGESGFVKFYPNPTNGLVNVEVSGATGESFELSVINIQGKVMMQDRLLDLPESYVRQLDLSSFAKGIYFVRLSSGQNTTVQKVTLH